MIARDAGDDSAWRPRILSRRDAPSAEVCDTLMMQLAELIETRHPERRFSQDELAELSREHIASRIGAAPADEYGNWIYYPWSRRLVHVLPEDEYRFVRTSRNRNKITLAEQALLAKLRVGVVGLSVGHATAVTLALEGIGGEYRLADFDTLSLSNMNRLRSGVHDIGVNKAVLAAREIFEIDPYVTIEVFSQGISEQNIDSFFENFRGTLNLIFEECDDLAMKVRLREEARRRRIPLLMETSDRGMLDIERFDLDPARPLLHGVCGDLDAQRLAGRTTREKVPIVLKIIGERTMSLRMAASLVDIDVTLKTWPQLASGVALGGALNADAARRIALGTLTASGRYYVDLEALVSNAAMHEITPAAPEPASRSYAPALLPAFSVSRAPPDDAAVRTLVAHAALAPSGGNRQPWRFVWKHGVLDCIHDAARSRSFLDFEHRATYLAFGAVRENLERAARAMGLFAEVTPFPAAREPSIVCRVRFERGEPPTDRALEEAHAVRTRVTNRKLGPRTALADADRAALVHAAEEAGAHLALCEAPDALNHVAKILGRGDRLRFVSEPLHHEMMDEIRWTDAEACATKDGLYISTLEWDEADLAGARLVSAWPVAATIRAVGGGAGLGRAAQKSIDAAAAVGLITWPGADARAYFDAGRAVQRVWLAATARGLAFQPMTALTYLFARFGAAPATLDAGDARELGELESRFREVFPARPGSSDVMLFRLAHASAPSARSLRRNVDEILDLGKMSRS